MKLVIHNLTFSDCPELSGLITTLTERIEDMSEALETLYADTD